MVNHSSRRINKVVYDQQSEGICFAIALSDSVTCLYKLRYLSKMKRLGKSRRRLNKLKLFRLSPQSLIDKGFKGLKNTSWYITDVRKGFQHVGVYRVARIKGCENYQLGKHYPVDGVKMYRGEPYIKAKLEKHFGPGGPKHSVVGCVFMGELTSKKAKEAYEKNTPYKHPELFDNLRDADHAIVITGIYTDGKPENHFVELKNSYGLAWGHEGYTKVAFSFIKMIMIPCMEEKEVNSSVTNMARKKSLSSLMESDLKGKRVFFRADLNVPLDGRLEIIDDALIHVAVPTIKYLTSNGARVILSSHLGRPKGVNAKLSLKPLVPRLSELLGIEVKMADDCVGPDVEKLVAEIREGGVLLLENLMFYKEEEENDPEFAKKLASLADLYVIDGFGTAHMANASTDGVAKHLKPCFAGFMQKERDFLVGTASNPKKPVAAIVGGSKMSSKISLIESLLNKVEIIILGGGMIFTFYKAQGLSVGSSLVEEDNLILAASLLEKAKAKGVSLLLPSDVVIADKFAPDANSKIVPASSIPDDWMGLDIGPDTIKSFSDTLDTTKAVIWNGPMGVSQFEKFAAGTEAIAHKLVDLSGKGVTTIIGGGALVAAVEKVGLADKMSYISTGGGASLELLEGNPLLGVLPPDET